MSFVQCPPQTPAWLQRWILCTGWAAEPSRAVSREESLEWGDPYPSTPPDALHVLNYNNPTLQQCLKMRAAFSGGCQESVLVSSTAAPHCCALQPPHTLLSCWFSLPTTNLTQLFLKLSLPFAVNCITATVISVLVLVRRQKHGLWALCE